MKRHKLEYEKFVLSKKLLNLQSQKNREKQKLEDMKDSLDLLK